MMHDVFYFTDIHGEWRLYRTMVDYCKKQDSECTIIFGGDACDRGQDGYKIMKDIIADPQIIYLTGNHEYLFVRACDAIIGHHAQSDELYNKLHSYTKEQAESFIQEFAFKNVDVNISCGNGGLPTLVDWILDGADEEFVDTIRMLPYTFSYENYDFCHAGSTYSYFKEVADEEYENMQAHFIAEQKILWDRDCIPLGWENGRICVHGHTPTIYLPSRAYGSRDKSPLRIHPAVWGEMMGGEAKRGGKKIDMDTGACFTGRAYLMNVLTKEVIGFYDSKVTNGDIDVIYIFEKYTIEEKTLNED